MAVDVTGYMSVAQFRVRTRMPQSSVDELEVTQPDFLQTALNDWSAWIDARLAKRYAAPFGSPPPTIILLWLEQLVTPEAYTKLGWNPSSASDQAIIDRAKQAREDIKEAAGSKEGLFELPLRSDTNTSGVSRAAPLSYSEASPYRWADLQAQTASSEDYS